MFVYSAEATAAVASRLTFFGPDRGARDAHTHSQTAEWFIFHVIFIEIYWCVEILIFVIICITIKKKKREKNDRRHLRQFIIA